MAETPIRYVRVPDEVWEAAMRRAQRERIPLSLTIRRFLAHYGKED